MIEILKKSIRNHINCNEIDDTMCSNILLDLEENGMQPPEYFNVEYYDEPECDGMITAWEPECDVKVTK
jgi:hypothetical protein